MVLKPKKIFLTSFREGQEHRVNLDSQEELESLDHR
jgi:hypothetical protein